MFEYDNPAYFKKPVWGGIGTAIPGGDVRKMDDKHDLETSSMNYVVDKLPVYRKWVDKQNKARYFEVPEFFMTVRRDLSPDNPAAYLGQVGETYTTIQNSSLRDFAVQLSETGELIFETAGTLRNGKLAWMLARCPQTIRIMDDEHQDYLLVSTSHDGSEAFVTALIRVRNLCWNVLSVTIKGTEYWYKLRHTDGATWKAEEAKAALSMARKFSTEFTSTMWSFAREEVNKRFVDTFLKTLIPGEDVKKNKKGLVVETPASRTREEVAALIYGGQIGGNTEACMRNGNPTLYGCFSAFTQWGETSRTVRCQTQADGKQRNENEARMDSVFFGSFAQKRQEAFDVCAAWAGLDGYNDLRQQITEATIGN